MIHIFGLTLNMLFPQSSSAYPKMPFWNKIRANTGFTGALLLLAGFCFSRVMISAGVFLLILHPWISQNTRKHLNELRSNFTGILFLVFFITGLYTYFSAADTQAFWNKIRIHLPMLLLPFSLVMPSFLSNKKILVLMLVFISGVFVAGMVSVLNYLLHYREFNEEIIRSGTVPVITGINHIYYGILLAFACISGLLFILEKRPEAQWLRILLGILTFGNLVILHSISSRTGIGAFYAGILLMLLFFIVRRKLYLTGLLGILLAGGILILGVKFIKPLHYRYQNTVADISKYWKGENPNYWSIAMRLEAWEKSWHVFKDHPWLGVGVGNVHQASLDKFEEMGTLLLEKNRKGPHNQFLYVLCSTGIAGFIIFLLLFLYPLRLVVKNDNYWGLALWGVIFFAFMFESVLERQVGVTFFTFFWMVVYHPRFRNF